MITERFIKMKWWQVALLSLALSALAGLASGKSDKKERAVYTKELKQAPWAPPGWVFGPAWTLNNLFLLLALQKQLADKRNYRSLLIVQGAIWLIFFTFGYVYFNRKSSILAAVWTVADAGLAAVSFGLAFRKNRSLSCLYLPLLAWTSFAGTVAVYQALKNPDPLLGTHAPME